MDTHPEDAAEAAVDEGRLLDGEDPSSSGPEDVEHWISVYQELVDFKDDVLGRTRARLGAMQEDAAREVEKTDLVVMETEAARLRRRLQFWTRRRTELAQRPQ